MCENTDNASVIYNVNNNITSRVYTPSNNTITFTDINSRSWGDTYPAVNVSSCIQQVINRENWEVNNSILLKLSRLNNNTVVDFITQEQDNGAQLSVTYSTPSQTKSGIVSTTIGAIPFYTNQSNPRTINLSKDQSQLVTFWVNATGDIGTTHKFFAYANITSNMSISNITSNWNVTISDYSYCYQEFANVSTVCGGLNTGLYAVAGGSWSSPVNGHYDGSWETYTNAYTTSPARLLYINYTKPTNANSSSLWEVKGGNLTVANNSINPSCWNYKINLLSFRVESKGSAYSYSNWTCYNGTKWVSLYLDTTNAGIYEEAMVWNITSS